jgi:hypothetical protein
VGGDVCSYALTAEHPAEHPPVTPAALLASLELCEHDPGRDLEQICEEQLVWILGGLAKLLAQQLRLLDDVAHGQGVRHVILFPGRGQDVSGIAT